MPALRTAILAAGLCMLPALAAEPPPGPASPALSRQPAGGGRAGGLQQIQPGHYVYLHTDDTPGVSSTFNSGIIVTGEGVVVVDALGSEASSGVDAGAWGRLPRPSARESPGSTPRPAGEVLHPGAPHRHHPGAEGFDAPSDR